MKHQPDFREVGCGECANGSLLGFDFTMALQPIVDIEANNIWAHEALVRGLNNEPAGYVFANVNDGNRYRFDQACRVKAIKLAAELGIDTMLSINFMPNAVYKPELCIRTTLMAAEEFNFPVEQIIFEITESEKIDDYDHLKAIVQYYQQSGFKTAIDDFGAGYSGLNMLADMQTDIVKLDMALVRHIDTDKIRQTIIRGILQVCTDLNIRVIAEGIETREELNTLKAMGITLFQGFYFARPAFQSVADIDPALFAA